VPSKKGGKQIYEDDMNDGVERASNTADVIEAVERVLQGIVKKLSV